MLMPTQACGPLCVILLHASFVQMLLSFSHPCSPMLGSRLGTLLNRHKPYTNLRHQMYLQDSLHRSIHIHSRRHLHFEATLIQVFHRPFNVFNCANEGSTEGVLAVIVGKDPFRSTTYHMTVLVDADVQRLNLSVRCRESLHAVTSTQSLHTMSPLGFSSHINQYQLVVPHSTQGE